MKTRMMVGALAIALAGVLATGQALGGELVIKETAQQKLERREAMRRAALVQHQQTKDYLARNCTKRDLTPAQLHNCRVAYRQL